MNYKTLHRISYGLYVISSGKENKVNEQIAGTVFQVPSEPPLIAVRINIQNLNHQFLQKNRKSAISILSKEIQ